MIRRRRGFGSAASLHFGGVLAEQWGPWDERISPAERLARLRSLRAIVLCGFGPLNPMFKALFVAESQEPGDLQAAALELDRMPARDRRKVLSVYGRLIKK